MRSFGSYRFPAVVLAFSVCVRSQTLQHRPAEPVQGQQASKPAASISLVLPPGTPIKVALQKDVKIRRAGQPLSGTTVEPVYAFDKLVIPVGAEVKGRITAIDDVSKKTRTLDALDADFSPRRTVHITFDELVLPNSRHMQMNTTVAPAADVLSFVTAKETKQSEAAQAEEKVNERLKQARRDLKQQFAIAKQQISKPDKMHRLERLALAQSPYRPQYFDAGTSFNADLQQQLSFGAETLQPESLTDVGSLPPSGGTIYGSLTTPLSSFSSKRNDEVEAVLSRPLIVADRLYLPQGTKLQGTVLQVRRARWLGRNGHLRIAFHRIVLPDGPMREVETTVEGVEVAKGENLALDSEGGAQVRTSRARYLSTGIALALAAGSATPDEDNGGVHGGGLSGGPTGGAANGALGFKLVGTIVGVAAHSQAVTAALGVYGAGHSVYSHFLARGRDIVYPKDMSMVLAIGDARNPAQASPQQAGR